MKARIALFVMAGIATLVLAFFNLFWSALFVCIAAAAGLGIWKARHAPWIKPAAILTSLAFLITAYFFNFLPHPSLPDSITESRFPPLLGPDTPSGYTSASTPTLPKPADMHKNFDETRYFKFRQRIPLFREIPTRLIDSGEILNESRTLPGVEEATNRLDEALHQLDESYSHYSADRVKAVLTKLNEGRDRIYELNDPEQIRNYRLEWDAEYHAISLDKIYEDLIQLQNALDLLAEQFIQNQLNLHTEFRASYESGTDSFHLDEWVHLTASKPLIREVKLDSLALASDFRDYEQSFLASYHNCTDGAELAITSLEVRQGEKNLCIVNRVTTPASSSDIAPQRLLDFQGLKFAWPRIYPSEIHLVLDLSSFGLSAEYPYSLELPRDSKISRIRLPRHSYFQSTHPFDVESTALGDVLVPNPSMTPDFFRRHDFVWIELLPSFPLIRSAWVQGRREYLFIENWTMALIVAALGALMGALFKKPD